MIKKTIAAVLLIGAVIQFSFSFQQKSSQEAFERIVASFFFMEQWAKKPSDYPDTNLKYMGTNRWKQTGRLYARNQCGLSPANLYENIVLGICPDAMPSYSIKYDVLKGPFKAMFGQEVLKNTIPSADGGEFRCFNPEGLKAAFEKLYRKPGDKFKDLNLQSIYNATIKEMMQDAGRVIVKVMSKKDQFQKLSAGLLAKVKTDKNFDAQQYAFDATKKLLGENYASDYFCLATYRNYYPARIVSFMLRRQCDGCLPVLLSSYKTIIKDYDPDFFREVGSKF